MMQRVRSRWSTEAVVSGGVLIFGLATLAAGVLRLLTTLGVSMLIGGAAWILFISLFNVLILTHTPDWVRARVLAVSMLVFQGAMAAGSATWGVVATRTNIHVALVCAGVGTIATTALGLFLKLPDATVDLTPWVHWRLPTILKGDPAADDAGPILVTVEYDVGKSRSSRQCISMDVFGDVTAPIDGESFRTWKNRIATSKHFWWIPGPNTRGSTSA
jgi:MFS family permease